VIDKLTRKYVVDQLIKHLKLALTGQNFFNQLKSIKHFLSANSLCVHLELLDCYICIDLVGVEIYVSEEPVEKDFQYCSLAQDSEISLLLKILFEVSQKANFAIRLCDYAKNIINTPGEVEMLPEKSYMLGQVLYWYSKARDSYLRIDPDTAFLNWLTDPSDEMSMWQYPSLNELQNALSEISLHYIKAYESELLAIACLADYLKRKSSGFQFSYS
jgi:hypothetical protein